MFLVFVFLGSPSLAKIVQDVDLEVITQVINSPTKNIVEQKIGNTVIIYKWIKWLKKYDSIKGVVVEKGIEQDSKGREYNYVIVYFKNGGFSGGNFHKITQYPWKKDSVFVLSGISTVDLPVVHFRMTKDSWTDIYNFNKKGGYGEDVKYAAP